MIIFYDDDNKIIGTVESPFEDVFEVDGAKKIKINEKELSHKEYKEITSHRAKIKSDNVLFNSEIDNTSKNNGHSSNNSGLEASSSPDELQDGNKKTSKD